MQRLLANYNSHSLINKFRYLTLNARYSNIIASHADVLSARQAILRSWERNAWRIPENVCVGGILVSSARVYIEKHLQLKYTVSMPDCISRTLLLENIQPGFLVQCKIGENIGRFRVTNMFGQIFGRKFVRYSVNIARAMHVRTSMHVRIFQTYAHTCSTFHSK